MMLLWHPPHLTSVGPMKLSTPSAASNALRSSAANCTRMKFDCLMGPAWANAGRLRPLEVLRVVGSGVDSFALDDSLVDLRGGGIDGDPFIFVVVVDVALELKFGEWL